MRSAIELGGYFTSHAVAAFDLMRADHESEDAAKVLKWITGHGLTSFTRREAHHDLLHAFPKAIDLDLPLERLQEHGYLRPFDAPHSGPGRPPSPRFEVNPRALKTADRTGTITPKVLGAIDADRTDRTDRDQTLGHGTA